MTQLMLPCPVLSFLLVAGLVAQPPQSGASETKFDELSRRAAAVLQSDPAEAVRLYRQALAIRPSSAEDCFYLAAGLYGNSQYAESRKAFQRAAALAPKNGAVWAFLGLCEYRINDYAQALSDIQKGEVLRLPDDRDFLSKVRNCAALIYLRSSDFGSAIQQLKPLAKIGDDSPTTILAFGVSALTLPYLPSSVPADKKAMVELAGRAEWTLCADGVADPKPLFQQLAEQYPNESSVHYLYGIYLLRRDPALARAEFQKELSIAPAHVSARLQIAILDIKAGNAQSAVTLANEALKLQPDNPLSHAVLGRAFVYMDQYAKGIPELEIAAKLAPQNLQLHFSLAQAYRRVGRNADARKEAEKFERLKSLQGPMVPMEDATDMGQNPP